MGYALNSQDIAVIGCTGFTKVLVEWHKSPLLVKTRSWNGTMGTLTIRAARVTTGRFYVSFDRENEMTSHKAYFNIRCEDAADFELLKKEFEHEQV